MSARGLLSLALAAASAAAIAIPARAEAAGMITHAWMADDATRYVDDPALKQLLILHNYEVLSGGSYPDTGYFNGQTQGRFYNWGETPHWERFIGAYIEDLRSRPGCGDLTNPLGPCAPQVGHLLGTAAHGMGDEMWDWMFEPLVTDHGEVPEHPLAPDELNGVIGNIEYAMDTIALADHFRWGESGFYAPPPSEMKPIFHSIGVNEVEEEDLVSGYVAGNGALAAERLGGAIDAPRVREQMPWSSANFPTESGGVYDTAQAIAGYFEAIWAKLQGQSPPPRVIAVHPEAGETGVPYIFHPAKTSPGPHTGGGELRIIAVLSNAVETASVTPENFYLLGPDGSAVRTREAYVIPSHQRGRMPHSADEVHDHGLGFEHQHTSAGQSPVAPLGGYPRPGPYGNGDGTHNIMFYPAGNLEPCTTYTAVATTGLRDWAEIKMNEGQSLEQEVRWSFQTRSADGQPCPDIPDPPDPPDPPDAPRCHGEVATLWATGSGGGVLRGTPDRDVIVGGPGKDVIRGGAGDDLICGAAGSDDIRGGAGDDEIHAKGGADLVSGNAGNDLIRANAGDDRLNAGAGDDEVHAGAGDDDVRGNAGDDRVRGKAGDDMIRGGTGSDRCNGGSGHDHHGGGCESRTGIP